MSITTLPDIPGPAAPGVIVTATMAGSIGAACLLRRLQPMPGDSAAIARPVPRVTGQLESSLYVTDLDRSRAFYEKVFGFETLLQEPRMVGLAVPGGSVLLLFRRGGSVEPSVMPGGTIPPHDGQGTQHLCFAVPLAELEAWERHLAALGIAIESRVTQSFGGRSLYFRDPDGHSLEVAGPGLWATY